MHIKTGTWESSNAVCEPDSLCDPAVLVSAANSEPHIRNRRLSPGSGNCGGGGGGGGGGVCLSGSDQPPRQLSPDGGGDPAAPGHPHAFGFRREKERKGQQQQQQHKGRPGLRQKGAGRGAAAQRGAGPKERWVEDGLSLLKPPPAFPVQDSPAKLQPAVSYASKVKAGASGGALEEEEEEEEEDRRRRPAIGVLLQNQWGLSFISEARPAPEGPAPNAPPPTDATHPADPQPPATSTSSTPPVTRAEVEESNGKLLLSCRHLVEALNYHSREFNAVCNRQRKDSKRVVWYKEAQENPA